MMNWPHWPMSDTHELRRLEECLASRAWSRGPVIEEFEKAFAAFCGSRYALLVNSGTAALTIGLQAIGIGPGDEVIIPGLTWPSTALAVLDSGAKAVVVDIEPDTYAISVNAVRSKINSRTRAIVAVHLYCSTADMDALLELGAQHDIIVVEDAAQALGSQWQGQALGTFGAFGAFSFQQKKQITCGEGGCLITADERLFNEARALRDHGHVSVGGVISRCGGNHRIAALCASVLLAQIERLPGLLAQESRNGQFVTRLLDQGGLVDCLRCRLGVTRPSYYSVCFRLREASAVDASEAIRKRLASTLHAEFTRAYPPLDDPSFFAPTKERRYRDLVEMGDLTQCHRARIESIRFPHQYLLSPREQLAEMAQAIVETVRHYSESRQ